MPASISGTVFDDLNGNGTLDPGEPGIPNAFVVLRNPNGFCTTTQTNASGNYTFSNLTVPGSYTIYETVEDPGATCPPVTFTQPTGFNTSTTPRTLTVNITQTQINNNVAFINRNFGHQSIETWPCSSNGLQVAGTPSATMFEINLVTGASNSLGTVTPPGLYNAIGFSALDNTIWGYRIGDVNAIVRINPDLTADTFTVPNLPGNFLVGDVDLNGHLYLYNPNDPLIFYVVDVDPNSPTYLQLVDPVNGFILDTAPFGTNLSSPANVFDWAFNPVDNQLYGIDGTTGQVIRINPLTGVVTNLTTTGIPTGSFYGAVFFFFFF
ncbi:hypothetical protein LWS67_21280, partial [Bacillus atrophaeus]|uniref:DUF6923 family protein n=1 Tax=Bacillus atrophaeus TaxID=1452 RepID=UPI001EFC1FA8